MTDEEPIQRCYQEELDALLKKTGSTIGKDRYGGPALFVKGTRLAETWGFSFLDEECTKLDISVMDFLQLINKLREEQATNNYWDI